MSSQDLVSAAVETAPAFAVLGVTPVVPSLAPALRFDLHVADPLGRDVITIALSTQIQLEPAKRVYDAQTKARLVELFGAPDRWGATTHAFQWARVEVLVPSFTGATSFALELPCSYDLEVAAARYCYSLPDGVIPLAFHFSGMVLSRDDDNLLSVERVPWSCSAHWSMPVEAWRRAVTAQYPGGGWIALQTETLDRLAVHRADYGDHSFDATVRALLDGRS
jgi:hypothetical protein